MRKLLPVIVFGAVIAASPAFAARCGGDFNIVRRGHVGGRAGGRHLRERDRRRRSPAYQQDAAVLNFDRRQRYTFNKTFEQYVSTRVGAGRINGGRAMLARHAALLSRIEARFGVPRQILVAIWGLETDFGKGDMGKLPVIRTLTTLAHDCRRSELFQGELLAALKIVQRGDLPLRDLIGAFAGEIGQTQFLPSSYIKYGVDFDGDGRVDLRHSRARRARLHRESVAHQRLQDGRALRRRHGEFRSHARMEPRHHLPQDDRVFRRSAGGAVAKVSHTPCRPCESRDP